jgi:hypothetical protein
MSSQLDDRIRTMMQHVVNESPPPPDLPTGPPPALVAPQRVPNWAAAVGAAVAVFILIGGVVWLVGGTGSEVIEEPMPAVTTSTPPTVPDATPPDLVSVTQVVGGSVSTDPSPTPVFVGDATDVDGSRMATVTVGGPGLVAGGSSHTVEVEGSDAAVWVSSDGRAWQRIDDDAGVFGDAMSVTGAGSDQFINDIAGGSLGVVAVGADGLTLAHDAAVWISNDGSVWERLPHDADVFGGEGDQFMHSVVQTSGSVIVVGESGGVAAAWVSRDGTQWARADVNDESIRAGGEPSVMNDVAEAGVGLVAVGSAGVDLGPAVWLSPDGVTWERLVDSMAGEQSGFSTDELAMSPMTAVAAGEHGLVAIGTKLLDASSSTYGSEWSAGPVVWTSADGYEWQLLDSSFLEVNDQQETSPYAYLKRGSPVWLEDVAWDGDRMLAIGGYELIPSGTHDNPGFVTIWTSTDGGSTWQVTGETTLPPTGSQSHRGARSFTRLGNSVVLAGSDDIPVGRHPDHGWMTYGSTPGVWIANLPAP